MKKFLLPLAALAFIGFSVPLSTPSEAQGISVQVGGGGYGRHRARPYAYQRGRHYGWNRGYRAGPRIVVRERSRRHYGMRGIR